MSNSCKKTKMGRAAVKTTAQQLQILIAFMREHPELNFQKLSTTFTAGDRDALWEQLRNKLNSQRVGPQKSVEKWKKTWIDWKSKVKGKRANNKREGGGVEEDEEAPNALKNVIISNIHSIALTGGDPTEPDVGIPAEYFKSLMQNDGSQTTLKGDEILIGQPQLNHTPLNNRILYGYTEEEEGSKDKVNSSSSSSLSSGAEFSKNCFQEEQQPGRRNSNKKVKGKKISYVDQTCLEFTEIFQEKTKAFLGIQESLKSLAETQSLIVKVKKEKVEVLKIMAEVENRKVEVFSGILSFLQQNYSKS